MLKFLPTTAAAFLAALAFPTITHADVSPIRVKVEASTSKEASNAKDKAGSSQERTLAISVTNSGAEAADVKIKYVVFGRDVVSKDIVSVGDGELTANVKPRGTEKVMAPAAKATITEPKQDPKKPKVDPSGQKIVGHGAQVYQGETLVAEFYEPVGMKEFFGKAKSPTRGVRK